MGLRSGAFLGLQEKEVKPFFLTGLVLFTTLGLWPPGGLAQLKPRVRFAATTASITTLPVEVGIEKGFFSEEGLQPEMIFIRSTDIIMKAMMVGEIDYATVFPSSVAAAARGLPIKVVGAMSSGTGYALVARPQITRIEDLRGKIFAISSFGAASDYVTYVFLEKNGIYPEKEAKFIAVGGSSSRLAAVVAGSADATGLVAPFHYQAEKLGLRIFVTPEEMSKWVALPTSGYAVADSKIKKSPEEIVKVIRATQRATRFIKDHREVSVAIAMKWLRVDRDTGERIYNIAKEVLVDDLIVSDDLVRNSMDLAYFRGQERPNVTIEKIRDWSFAEKAKR